LLQRRRIWITAKHTSPALPIQVLEYLMPVRSAQTELHLPLSPFDCRQSTTLNLLVDQLKESEDAGEKCDRLPACHSQSHHLSTFLPGDLAIWRIFYRS